MHDLALFPSGSSIFVDTNIFYLHYQGKSPTCTAFIRRIARGEVKAYVNTEVLSDLLHKMMLAEAYQKRLITQTRAIDLKRCLESDRSKMRLLTDHQALFENTLDIGIKVLRVSKGLIINTKTERLNHGLMTNDSLHLGSMNRHKIPIDNLATNDGDFFHISSLTVWKPNDVWK